MCSIIGYLGSSISAQDLRAGFDKTISRGPDDTRMLHIGAATLGFHRLAIMGLHPEGMQPFTRDGSALVCNGEIYGFRPLKRQLTEKGYSFRSGSDCDFYQFRCITIYILHKRIYFCNIFQQKR
mgnify:CR=1 FL=1